MNTTEKLIDFIDRSPTAYQVIRNVCDRLEKEGYTRLSEGDTPRDGGKYYVIRNGTALIAFRQTAGSRGFMISASHSDSPCYKVKMSGECTGAYLRLETEPYGGMMHYTWLDRPLSVAGRVVVRTGEGIATRLVDLRRDVAVIPSVAIHMNRDVNNGYKFNPAVDLLPLVGSAASAGAFRREIATAADTDERNILEYDLYLYNRDAGRRVGINGELVLSPRLDDLECVFGCLEGFLAAEPSDATPVFAVFDNEEVGSSTKQGAASPFLYDVLLSSAGSKENYDRMIRSSFMVSADNAHAVHPNHPELADRSNAPVINSGIVVKYNSNQKYTTDAPAAAIFSLICSRAGVPVQRYYNRADIPGGSTLGSISDTRVPVMTVDIGLAQLAMHSACETAGAEDTDYLCRAMTSFYSSSLAVDGENINVK